MFGWADFDSEAGISVRLLKPFGDQTLHGIDRGRRLAGRRTR